MNCVNINNTEFKKLLEESKLSSLELETFISNWQDKVKLDRFPTLNEIRSNNLELTKKEMLVDLQRSIIPKKTSDLGLSLLAKDISKANDRLKHQGVQRVYKIENRIRVGQSSDSTFDVKVYRGNLNTEDKNNRKLFQKLSTEGEIASEKTIRDLAARIADRIGMSIRFESDRTKQYKGKIENGVAYINLAYATLDTPIHEILGHPIIRAIKQGAAVSGEYVETYTTTENGKEKGLIQGYYDKNSYSVKNLKTGEVKLFDNFDDAKTFQNDAMFFGKNTQLYQNLLKELETGKGKEVLDRVKRDYNKKQVDLSKIPLNANSTEEEYNSVTAQEILKAESGKYKLFEKIGDEFLYSKTISQSGRVEYRKIVAEKYTLEEQQEEAIVELLGLMTAEKLDNVKDGKLISLLKRLLKEMKAFMKQLLGQKEVEIDKLPDNMTLGDLSDILAYSNSKLILPGYEVEYTTPDNKKFKTYQEASNHISELAKKADSNSINENINSSFIGKIDPITRKKIKFISYLDEQPGEFSPDDNVTFPGEPASFEIVFEDNSNDIIYENDLIHTTPNVRDFYNNIKVSLNQNTKLNSFIQRNKEYEQSKKIIEEWKKINNIQYNPEEIYSRGQEFSSVVGAYSSFDINLMMQNLLQHIEDNEKAGGKFAISAYTKPIDKFIGHLEGSGGKIKFKIYPKSEDILWAANTDAYSGSVWDASEKINKDKKSELLGVSYTKYPSLNNVNSIQPNLTAIVDDLNHHHNELGIVLTGNNFRLEYDEDIPYTTKKIIDGINSILDQKALQEVENFINTLEKEC